MTASILDGKHLAALKMEVLRQKVDSLSGSAPGLAVILLGEDPASHIYVKNKRKACSDIGMQSFSYDLPASTSQKELEALIDTLNESSEVNGILVQLPLPSHIDTATILDRISPLKDVDGFHPCNMGRLAQKRPLLRPCTPMGIVNLLNHYQIPIASRHALVIGASNIVGRPMGLELLMAGATTTICHRQTPDLQPFVALADIVVVATGIKDVIDVSWLKPHQVVVDVGMHRQSDGSLRGDVDFAKARELVSWITPVPGGVGPMTIVSLLENTLLAASYQHGTAI